MTLIGCRSSFASACDRRSSVALLAEVHEVCKVAGIVPPESFGDVSGGGRGGVANLIAEFEVLGGCSGGS
jgi:hypothetical protein